MKSVIVLGLVWTCVACVGMRWFLDSFYQGSLVFDGAGRMRLDLPSGDDANIVWPSGTPPWTRGDRRVRRDSSGREPLGEGDRLRFAGGYIAGPDEVSDYLAAQRQATRERCPGPYWLVTPGSLRRFSS